MKNIRDPHDELQSRLFRDDQLTWWASRLAPNALAALQTGWEGVFRRSILTLLPGYELEEKFDSPRGRATKELRVRGIDAVNLALPIEAAGWNIAAAVKIKQQRRRKAKLKTFGRPSRCPWGALQSLAAFANRLFAAIRPPATPAGARNGIFVHAVG